MSTSLPVKCHLPLITTRIEFQFNVLSPPPRITPRRDLGAVIQRQARRATPYTRSKRGATPVTHRAESPLTDVEDSDSGNSDSGTSDVEEKTMSSHKVLKPKGEVGRKNSGGYNLQVAMGWEDEEFAKFTKYINDEVGKILDIAICYSKQERKDLDKVIQSTAKRFKMQGRYHNDWPIRDALKLRLKYTSDWEKKKENRRIEANLRQALKPKPKDN